MAFSRTIIAGAIFFGIMIANEIERFYPNDLTASVRNPLVSMSLYSIALLVLAFPLIKKGNVWSVIVASCCVVLAGVLTWLFWMT